MSEARNKVRVLMPHWHKEVLWLSGQAVFFGRANNVGANRGLDSRQYFSRSGIRGCEAITIE
jgi:hypothetical protein